MNGALQVLRDVVAGGAPAPPAPASGRRRRLHDHRVECADALTFARSLPTGSVQLILTDPPYNVRKAAWDTWPSDDAFLAWLGEQLAEWHRVLAPNGTLYSFTSAEMGGRVECLVREQFSVLNHVAWRKERSRHSQCERAALRAYFPQTERIIVAEHHGADESARNGHGAGFVFEPLRAWFAGRLRREGISAQDVNAAIGSSTVGGGMTSHYLGRTQFEIPTPEVYEVLRARWPAAFDRSYEDLRAEYERLAERFKGQRRAFALSVSNPFTDVWDYPVVQRYPGKHVTEKPPEMALDIVRASSRPGDVVADFFSGSGTFPAAAAALGRIAWAGDIDPRWAAVTADRVRRSAASGRLELAIPRRGR